MVQGWATRMEHSLQMPRQVQQAGAEDKESRTQAGESGMYLFDGSRWH